MSGTVKEMRALVEEIQGDPDPGDMGELADELAGLAGSLLAELDQLVAQLPRGDWGSDELGTLANWLQEHGYAVGSDPDEVDCGPGSGDADYDEAAQQQRERELAGMGCTAETPCAERAAQGGMSCGHA